MESNWAAQHLQTIRMLMERSSLYRRALGPIMLVAGSIGLVAAIIGRFAGVERSSAFAIYWLMVGAVAVLASLILVRRQALTDKEPFWSPPTRRVAQGLMPAFIVGLLAGVLFAMDKSTDALEQVKAAFSGRSTLELPTWFLPCIWLICYGCGLHSAGFFMQRGIRWFGWAFVLFGCAGVILLPRVQDVNPAQVSHMIMGTFFGLGHLAYGVYLYSTEKRKNAA